MYPALVYRKHEDEANHGGGDPPGFAETCTWSCGVQRRGRGASMGFM